MASNGLAASNEMILHERTKLFICNLDDNLLCLPFLGIDRFTSLLEANADDFFSAFANNTESDLFLFLDLWLLTERIGTGSIPKVATIPMFPFSFLIYL